MQERYRKDYDGEFIITNTIFRNGKKVQEREWIDNPIENHFISPRSVVISNGASRQNFPILRLQNHKGGLLGKQRLQSYGCNGVWREIQLDFYVDTTNNEHKDIIENKYNDKVIVYTSSKKCIQYPSEFYLIPNGVSSNNDEIIAMYLAAFDGHDEVYCVGVDGLDENFKPNMKVVKQLESVIKTYKNTKFIFVNNSKVLHPEWQNCSNVSLINYSKFITVCDI